MAKNSKLVDMVRKQAEAAARHEELMRQHEAKQKEEQARLNEESRKKREARSEFIAGLQAAAIQAVNDVAADLLEGGFASAIVSTDAAKPVHMNVGKATVSLAEIARLTIARSAAEHKKGKRLVIAVAFKNQGPAAFIRHWFQHGQSEPKQTSGQELPTVNVGEESILIGAIGQSIFDIIAKVEHD